MITQVILYLSMLGIGSGSLVILYFMLRKSREKLPDTWKKSLPFKHFQIGVLCLMLHFFLLLINEVISNYIGFQGIYNTFIMSIGFTLYTPFLFGFLFIYTQTAWKRSSYVLLYLILVGYLIAGGYFHPDSVFQVTSGLVFACIYFLAALIHLTDLLMNPKSEHFRFQLKVNISILVYNMLSSITTSFLWSYTSRDLPYLDLFFNINIYLSISYYFALNFIFIHEILKLRRR